MVRSEAEALLLENNLIKTLAPRYNILFRDDKSYPYLKIVSHAVYPRVAFYRGSVDRKHRYFGPYPSAWAVKEIDPAAAEGVPPAHLRGHGVQQPHPALPAVPDQALLGALRRPDQRRRTTRATSQIASAFLQGDQQEVMDDLQAQMMERAEALAFEQAAEIRNQIGAVARAAPAVGGDNTGGRPDADILVAVKARAAAPASTWRWCAAAATWATGRTFPSNAATALPEDSARRLHRCSITSRTRRRRAIYAAIAPWPTGIAAGARRIGQAHGAHPRAALQPAQVWLEMAEQNAQTGHGSRIATTLRGNARDLTRCSSCSPSTVEQGGRRAHRVLRHQPHQGEATEASCVVFEDHNMARRDYRRFNIAGITRRRRLRRRCARRCCGATRSC